MLKLSFLYLNTRPHFKTIMYVFYASRLVPIDFLSTDSLNNDDRQNTQKTENSKQSLGRNRYSKNV